MGIYFYFILGYGIWDKNKNESNVYFLGTINNTRFKHFLFRFNQKIFTLLAIKSKIM